MFEKKRVQNLMKRTPLTVKHRGGSIILWACVAASGAGNITLVEGRMDSIKYRPILEANITPSVNCKQAEDEKRMASPK